MSTTSNDAELSVAARSSPPPPYPSPTHSLYSNGGSPQNAASSNSTHQLPRARNIVKQGSNQSQKRGNHLTPKGPALELGSIASSLQRKSSGVLHSVSNLFTLSPTLQEDSVNGTYDNDPVVNTIRQLKKEDRRDRDMCCGFAPKFRSAFKALWMFASVIIVWTGFIGLEQCKGQLLVAAYVSVQGFILLIYLGLVEVSGAVAISKGRRWGVLVLLLSQPLVLLPLCFGYVAILPTVTPGSEQLMKLFEGNYSMNSASNATFNSLINSSMLMAQVNASSPTNGTAGSLDGSSCDSNYLNFAIALFALGHLMVGFVLLYSVVACACLVHAEEHRRRVEPPVITTESPVEGQGKTVGGGTLREETKL